MRGLLVAATTAAALAVPSASASADPLAGAKSCAQAAGFTVTNLVNGEPTIHPCRP